MKDTIKVSTTIPISTKEAIKRKADSVYMTVSALIRNILMSEEYKWEEYKWDESEDGEIE